MKKTGDIAKAMAYAQKALPAAERARDEDLIAEACYVLASIEDERENYARVRALPRARACRSSNRNKPCRDWRARTPRRPAGASRSSDIDDARGMRSSARSTRSSSTTASRWPRTTGSGGRSSSSQGEREAAKAKFEAARADVRGARHAVRAGAAALRHRLCSKDEPEEATQTIRSAIRIFERLDATHDLERARGALFRIKPAGKAPDSGVVGLYEVVKIINSTLNLEEVLNRVLDVAIRRAARRARHDPPARSDHQRAAHARRAQHQRGAKAGRSARRSRSSRK